MRILFLSTAVAILAVGSWVATKAMELLLRRMMIKDATVREARHCFGSSNQQAGGDVYWIVAPPALPLRSSCGNSTGGAVVTALGPNLHRVELARTDFRRSPE